MFLKVVLGNPMAFRVGPIKTQEFMKSAHSAFSKILDIGDVWLKIIQLFMKNFKKFKIFINKHQNLKIFRRIPTTFHTDFNTFS